MCMERSDDWVAMYSFMGSQATPWTKWECSASSWRHLPSWEEKIRATLSVLPATMYSPEGLQARSYTCIVPHLNVVRGFQYSFSCCISSGLRSLPYVVAWGVALGAQMMIIPSSPADAISSPFGQNRTTLTAAECLLNVARYSMRGGRAAPGVVVGSGTAAVVVVGLIFGCTIHTRT